MLINEIPLKESVKFVYANDSVTQLRDKFIEDNVSSELVVKDIKGDIIGIVTPKDVMQVSPDQLTTTKVSEICSNSLLTIEYSSTIKAAVTKMISNNCHHLIVIDKGELKGILSSLDIASAIADLENNQSPAIQNFQFDNK